MSGSSPKAKTLVIGLDAATMDLVGPWAAEGHLPALAALMQAGVSARLRSTPNMHSASAWTSILTGLSPGRHGLFVFSDRDFATGRQLFFTGGDRQGELISAHLDRGGHTAGFLNVPMTYPAQCTGGGYMVSGLDSPSLNDSAFCPSELRREVVAKFPDYAFSPPMLGELMRNGRLEEATDAWLALTETQTAVAECLMTDRPVDFLMTVFTASDWAGHNLWPRGDGIDHTRADGLLTVYRALDRAVERLVALAGPEARIFVISDHGMGPHSGASYHLAAWLESKGFMTRRPGRGSSTLSGARRIARKVLPGTVREAVKSVLGDDRLERLRASEKDDYYSTIEWSRTLAYTEPGRHVVNINLAGRNHEGTVPEAEYDAVRDRVGDGLIAWRDEDGRRVVDRVVRREEEYSGAFISRASDLHVYWNPEARLGDPPDEVKARGYWWRGDHQPDGILICAGPGIQPGATLESATVYDIAPTLLYMSGLEVPAGLDGRVVEEVATVEFRTANPVRMSPTSGSGDAMDAQLSQSEQELVEEKLKSLGYM